MFLRDCCRNVMSDIKWNNCHFEEPVFNLVSGINITFFRLILCIIHSLRVWTWQDCICDVCQLRKQTPFSKCLVQCKLRSLMVRDSWFVYNWRKQFNASVRSFVDVIEKYTLISKNVLKWNEHKLESRRDLSLFHSACVCLNFLLLYKKDHSTSFHWD